MKRIVISLDLSQEAVLTYYQGHIQLVKAKSLDGRTIQFPANVLRDVVTADGVHGYFEILYDEQGKFHGIQRIQE